MDADTGQIGAGTRSGRDDDGEGNVVDVVEEQRRLVTRHAATDGEHGGMEEAGPRHRAAAQPVHGGVDPLQHAGVARGADLLVRHADRHGLL